MLLLIGLGPREFDPGSVHSVQDEATSGEPIAQSLDHPLAEHALISSNKRVVHFRNIFMNAWYDVAGTFAF